MENILIKRDDENEAQYIFRIGQAKNSGLITETWEQINSVVNEQLGFKEEEWRDCSVWRKRFRLYDDAWNNIFSKEQFTDAQMSEYEDKKRELFKAKKQFEDQRRECLKLWATEARFDNLTDKLVESVGDVCNQKPLEFADCYNSTGECEAVLSFSDWHYGLVTDNIWNKYDTNICKQRVSKLISKTIQYLKRHAVKALHILLLGDVAHGGIHNSCRVASEENVCDQLMHASEIIAEAVNELSQYVSNVNVYATYGNHLRTIQNKGDSIHSDNMEKIVSWYLEQRLQNNNRVSIINSEFYEFIYLNVCGYNIVAAHGDLEKFKQFGPIVNTLFTKQYGVSIDYTISADKHHIEEFEQMGIESILVRSLCGTDDYANSIRAYSEPGQTLMIFSKEEGRECTYNIKL